MSQAFVTSRGRITIPASVRQALDVDVGDRVEFVQIEQGLFKVEAVSRSACGAGDEPVKDASVGRSD